MSDLNIARKAMLRLLSLFPVPAGTDRPCEVRCYLLDVDSYLESHVADEVGESSEITPHQQAAINALRDIASGKPATNFYFASGDRNAIKSDDDTRRWMVASKPAHPTVDIDALRKAITIDAAIAELDKAIRVAGYPKAKNDDFGRFGKHDHLLKMPLGFRMTQKAAQSYEDYMRLGWTLQSLLETGLVVVNSDCCEPYATPANACLVGKDGIAESGGEL